MNTSTLTRPTPKTPFDDYAAIYDSALGQGLAVSGEHSAYFARGRIERLAQCLQNFGDPPMQILDFGCGIGANAPLIQNQWPDIRLLLGVDVSAKCLELAERSFGSARVHFRSFGRRVRLGRGR